MMYFILITVHIALLFPSILACTDLDVLDGYCDPTCNNSEHEWDGGDCCEHTCIDSDYRCGTNGYDCKTPPKDGKFLYTKQYSGFKVILNCDTEAGAGYTVGYFYTLSGDKNDLDRKSSYKIDETVPKMCQQQFKGQNLPTYKHDKCTGKKRTKNPFCYDRGHVVMANHMDGTLQTAIDAGYVTNIVPQASGFNRSGGSWYATEQIIECHRDFPDVQRLDIFGGMLYNDKSNDYFLDSHGIPTPDIFYKVVVKYFKDDKKNPDVIAWLMQNSPNEKSNRINIKFNGIDSSEHGALINIESLKEYVKNSLDELPEQFTERAYDVGSSWESSNKSEVCKNGNSDEQFLTRSEL